MEINLSKQKQSGSILIMMVVLVMMIGVMFVSLGGVTNQQYQQGGLTAQDETAFQVAESGLNYARWRLAHNGNDFSSVQNQVYDQLKGVLGTYTLTFVPPQNGSTIVQITSVGHTATAPVRDVTLQATYGKPSFAKYAMLLNDDVWFGETISGAVHSNGGIRMDGQSDSTMTSAKATYTCKSTQGCSGNPTKPGVWGSGGNSALWQYPVSSVDYAGLTADLVSMKAAAQSANTYFGSSGGYGYHIVFNSNNTYSLYKVTSKQSNISSYFPDDGWVSSSYDIKKESLVTSATVPSGGILFFEDSVWVEGTVASRVTIASGKFPENPSTYTDIIINGSVTYGGVKDGTREFGAVSQGNVLIPNSGAANNLEMDGAFVAQHGRFGRRYYNTGSYILRNSITTYGMVASNLVPVTTWVNGSNAVIGGYQSGTSSYDSNLLYGPPPYFPTTGEYQFLSWQQK
ncbi:MAG: hypothetical protein K8Q97_01190 [Candidatus Andersenbacteria bacterium]|nr:hypothetical protein [Candidatus Andersenbacteria bacterium]